ncbi:MAG: DEAD/DEAH box helicase, partial [Oryzihumus sp.]
RTARAGNTGIAVTFVDWDDLHRWALINKVLDLGIPEPQETYSSSEHLFTDLDIPTTATGTLPKSARTREGLEAEAVEDLGETGKRAGKGGGRGEREPAGRHGSEEGGSRGRSRNRRSGGRGEAASGSTEAGTRGESGTRSESGSRGDADKPRRQRNRRRTRGGQPSGDAQG